MEIKEFIELGRMILWRHSKPVHSAFIGDRHYLGGLASVYTDKKIEITGYGQAIEIKILPGGHPKGLHNPVVLITEEGEVIRTHGEWTYIKKHVAAVARRWRPPKVGELFRDNEPRMAYARVVKLVEIKVGNVGICVPADPETGATKDGKPIEIQLTRLGTGRQRDWAPVYPVWLETKIG